MTIQTLTPPNRSSAPWPAQGKWRYEDYCRLPEDGWRYEILEGVLHMTPAPSTRHQATVGNLSFLLRSYLQDHPMGRLFFAPTDVLLPDNLAAPVQPDLLLVKNEHLERVREAYIDGAPDWIAEVLSPSNWIDDRREKYRLYAAAGVTEYWIVDLPQETIEVFHLQGSGYELLGRFQAGETMRSILFPEFAPEVDEILAE